MRVEIRQRKNIATEAIDKNGVMIKNTYPGAIAGSSVRRNMLGWVTGLTTDEEKKYSETLNVDLSKNSDYWENLTIYLSSPKNEYIVLDLENPQHYLQYKAALAGGIVAPNRESLNDEKYLNTDYYFFEIEKEQKKKKDISKERNKLLGKLSNHEDSHEWLLFINYALGLYIARNIKTERLYNQIDDRLSKLSKESEIKEVKNIFEKTPLELQVEFVVEKAIDNKTIVYDPTDLVYTYEGRKLGSTKAQTIQKFLDPQFTELLQGLNEEILTDYI